MKTEEIVRQHRRDDPRAVSRALRDTAPVRCAIVDSHGRPAPLSSAGYVLRPNRSYRVQVVSPFPDDELERLAIINPPDCVMVYPELKEVDRDGRPVRLLPFRARIAFWSHARRLGFLTVQCDELEVAHYFRAGYEKEVAPFGCPIVIRTPWVILLTSVVVGLLLILLPSLLADMVRGGPVSLERVGGLLQGLATSGDSWVWLLVLTVAVAVPAYALNAVILYRRSRQLWQQFRRAYPS